MEEPIDIYSKIQPLVLNEIQNYSSRKQFDVAKIPAHAHTGVDSDTIDFENIENPSRFILRTIVASDTNTTVANAVAGDLVMPFSGYITSIGATVDTAGTTNTTTIDVNKNGTTIMNTKITIDSAEKTSRTAVTPPVINTSLLTFQTGDIFTFDVDAISTTPAKGLTIFINVIET